MYVNIGLVQNVEHILAPKFSGRLPVARRLGLSEIIHLAPPPLQKEPRSPTAMLLLEDYITIVTGQNTICALDDSQTYGQCLTL